MAFDTFETRTVAASFEMRDDATTGAPILEGYAATFDRPYDMGPFWEQVDSRAFNRTLTTKPDVRLLVDHAGQPLARTKSGTLDLNADEGSPGLHVRAMLDPADPDVQRLLPKMRRGDLDEMSFAFRVAPGGDAWDYTNPEKTMRTLNEVSLAGGDVSVVTYPANPTTSVSVRARDLEEARRVFVEQTAKEMRAGRMLSAANLAKLRQVVDQIAQRSGPTANDTRDALGEAVIEAHGAKDVWTYVEDFDDTSVWFLVSSETDSDTFQQTYTLASGVATLTGDPVPVRRQTTYVPVAASDAAAADTTPARGLHPDMARRILAAADAPRSA